MPAQTLWTDAQCDRLRELTGLKWSCSQIGNEMGVTRNAVIGKQHRLGISSVDILTGEQLLERRAAVAGLRRQRQAERILGFKLRRPKPSSGTPLPDATPTEEIEMRPCTFWELTEETCRWPIGEPGTEGFHFCGAPSIEFMPYCPAHCRVAYRPVAGTLRTFGEKSAA